MEPLQKEELSFLMYLLFLVFISVKVHIAGDTSLNIPTINTEYWPLPYSYGVRVHSNSWGAPENTYTIDCADADSFVWDNKDFLPVFSAGNTGPGSGTIQIPGISKNCISVGCNHAPQESFNYVSLASTLKVTSTAFLSRCEKY